MPSDPFKGIHAIVYALFDAQERLDRAAMRRQTELCLSAGVHGMAALGLATEVSKLTEAERRTVMEWVSEDTAGRVPLGFTIFGGSVAEQVAGVRAAEAARADWVILQPPMVGSYAAGEYIRFFGRVADAAHVPVAIQNAPGYMGRGLTAGEIGELVRQHPNIRVLKAEGTAAEVQAVIEATEDRIPVFNGRAGVDLLDSLRAGCAGLILAPELVDRAARIFEQHAAGDQVAAEIGFAEILPAIFYISSIEDLICYGKRLFGARAGIAIHDRAPAKRPTPFGLSLVEHYAKRHGRLE